MSTKYKKYLQNPDVPVPKTTAWRYKKREGTNASTNEESQIILVLHHIKHKPHARWMKGRTETFTSVY